MAKPIGMIGGVVMVCLAASVAGFGAVGAWSQAATHAITRPVIAEDVSPLESIAPVAGDGFRGTAFLRKPPSAGPFPAVVVIHGGLVTIPTERLKSIALSGAQTSRFLAAGYVVATITYRSRDADPQSTVSLADSLAAVDHVRKLPYVDPKSIVLYGCSGGGDLALEVAAATSVAAIAPEEPATVLLSGIFNKDFPKSGERHTPGDAQPILADPAKYYTAQYQKQTREKLGRINTPILVLQGDEQAPLNRFNDHVLIPGLRAAGKQVEVKSYPGEPHCFAFLGNGPRAPAALEAFTHAEAFFRRHVSTKPKPVDPSRIKYEPAQ